MVCPQKPANRCPQSRLQLSRRLLTLTGGLGRSSQFAAAKAGTQQGLSRDWQGLARTGRDAQGTDPPTQEEQRQRAWLVKNGRLLVTVFGGFVPVGDSPCECKWRGVVVMCSLRERRACA